MAVIGHDVDLFEQIHVRSNVKDLLRMKSVSKSWYSLITAPHFIKLHLNHNYNEDRCNNELGQRRIVLSDNKGKKLVGSSNGLVCVITSNCFSIHACRYKVSVGNPLTREVVRLTSLPRTGNVPLCWGFGYDSSTDDYKVVVGIPIDENTNCFQVLSLKTNEWRVTGEVKFSWVFATEVGILCNGALHWLVRDENKDRLIAFDLAKEEFNEIPQPDDTRYQCTLSTKLGIVEDCLCIYQSQHSSLDRWIMKTYNARQSWDMLLRRDRDMKYDIVHYFSKPKFGTSGENNVCHWDYIEALVFVQSLVSPHVNGRPKRARTKKRRATCLNKGGPIRPGPSARV